MMSVLCIERCSHQLYCPCLIIICPATMHGPFPPPQDRVNIDHKEPASLNWDADIEKNESMLDVVKQPIKHFYILKEFDKNV